MSIKKDTFENDNRIDHKLKKGLSLSFKHYLNEIKDKEASIEEEMYMHVDPHSLNVKDSNITQKSNISRDSITFVENLGCFKLCFDSAQGKKYVFIDQGFWFDICHMSIGENQYLIDGVSQEWFIVKDDSHSISFINTNWDIEASIDFDFLCSIIGERWTNK